MVLTVVNILVILISSIINPIVLYGSIKRQALKSDSITVLLLEMLTGVDLVLTIVSVLPITVTLVARKWIFGPYICMAIALGTRYFYLNELILIVFISLHRLKLVLAKRGKSIPLLQNQNEFRFKVALGSLLTVPLGSIANSFSTRNMFRFEPQYMTCVSPHTHQLGWVITGVTLLVLSIMIVFISNTIILFKILRIKYKHSRVMMFIGVVSALSPGTRSTYRVRKVRTSTMITVLMIFVFFISSYLPVLVIFLRDFMEIPTSIQFQLLATELISLNVVVHPIIYTFTNRRFKQYLSAILRCQTFNLSSKIQKTKEDNSDSSDKFMNETISKFFSSRRSSFASMRSLRSIHSNRSNRSGTRRSQTVNPITSSDLHLNVVRTSNHSGSSGKHHNGHCTNGKSNGKGHKISTGSKIQDRRRSTGSDRSLYKQYSPDFVNIDTSITEISCLELMETTIL